MAALPQCDAFLTIWDPDGLPDVAKLVRLVRVTDANDNPISFEQRNTFTDDTGTFHFTLPQNATAYITSRASGMFTGNGPIAFKVPAASTGELVPAFPPGDLVVTPPLTYAGNQLGILKASQFQDGYISKEDFAEFASGGGGGGLGTVTEIDTGAGLTGGPITDQGTISHAQIPGLMPGTYTGPLVVQVNAYGHVVAIAELGDTTAPVISGVNTSGITATTATVNWTTNEQADSQVDYGTTTSYGSSTTLDPMVVITHAVNLTGLTAGTLYHFRIKTKDISGNLTTSGDFTFGTITAGDTTPPVISAVASSSITTTSAIVTWTTDEAADSQVEYGTSTAYGFQTVLNTSTVTSHSQNVTSLTAGTLYHFRVKSKDAAGNLATGTDNTFTTASGADTTPPVISAVASGTPGSTSATITWTTDEPADSQVEYGTTTAYGSSTTLNATLVTSHSVNLSGLTASTLYHFRVKSKDAATNMATSSDFTFTTATIGSSLNTGIVSYWKLNEGSGTTRVDSLGVNNLTEVVSAGTGVYSGTGKIGNCNCPGIGFSANYGRLECVDHPSQTPSGPFTVAGWILFSPSVGSANVHCLLGKVDLGSNTSWYVGYNAYVPTWEFRATTDGSTAHDLDVAAPVPAASTWYFMCAAWDGTNLRLSINDGTVSTLPFAGPFFHSTVPLTAGCHSYTGGAWSTVCVDEIGYWSRSLTAAEITQLYNYGNTGQSYPFP